MTSHKLRIEAFTTLGVHLGRLANNTKDPIYRHAREENPWFTSEGISQALMALSTMLSENELTSWAQSYQEPATTKQVGVVMAGNIPMVGFHDLLCVLMAGHQLWMKPGSQDSVLMTYLAKLLVDIAPDLGAQIQICERINNCEMVIATGSDNSSRYFAYYFKDIPRLIRKSRSSVGVITGNESAEELKQLGDDVFSYFGRGCRSVSKLYVPHGYDFGHMVAAWEKYRELVNHNKYANNYEYRRAIFLVGSTPFIEGGAVLLTENPQTASPIAVVHYETYDPDEDLDKKIWKDAEQLQCVVSSAGWFSGSIPFGKAQSPGISDYADGVDTMEFLFTQAG